MNNKAPQTRSKISQLMGRFLTPIALASTVILGLETTAQALSFNFSYDPGTSLEQMLGFETAGQIYSSYLTDNTTVNIHVGVTDLLPTDVIGGALPGLTPYQNYGNFRNSVYGDRTTSDDVDPADFDEDHISFDDKTAYNNLHNYQYNDGNTRYHAYFEGGSSSNYWYNKSITLTNANAKALGITPSNSLDGLILMSDLSEYSVDWNYNYNRQNAIGSNELDFLSVAMHEIGHVLGFVSGVDSTEVAEAQATYNQNVDRLMHTTSLDMYRYTNWSDTNGGYLDLAYGVDSYFSIDGGNTALAYMSEGKDLLLGFGGDGFQASHWGKSSNPVGIMDPDLALGERGNISDLDLRAFDVIGYDCAYFNYANSSYSCDAASLNLVSLENQAKTILAQKIDPISGVDWWIDWYIDNGYNYTAADWIAQDRIDDLIDMIEDSMLYEWGWGNGNGNGNGNCNPNCNGHPIELAQLLASEGMFEEASGFNWSTMAELEAQEVPEPGIKTGLLGLGLGLWASSSLLKRYRKKN